MLIKPLDLQEDPLTIHASLAAESMEYTSDVRQIGPLSVDGQADLLVEHRGPREFVDDIRLRAGYRGNFELLCARCLDPVTQLLESSFDLIFRPANADADGAERAITEEETEIGYYERSGLLLEDVVREQVLLSLPSRTLCQEDAGASVSAAAKTSMEVSAVVRKLPPTHAGTPWPASLESSSSKNACSTVPPSSWPTKVLCCDAAYGLIRRETHRCLIRNGATPSSEPPSAAVMIF